MCVCVNHVCIYAIVSTFFSLSRRFSSAYVIFFCVHSLQLKKEIKAAVSLIQKPLAITRVHQKSEQTMHGYFILFLVALLIVFLYFHPHLCSEKSILSIFYIPLFFLLNQWLLELTKYTSSE